MWEFLSPVNSCLSKGGMTCSGMHDAPCQSHPFQPNLETAEEHLGGQYDYARRGSDRPVQVCMRLQGQGDGGLWYMLFVFS